MRPFQITRQQLLRSARPASLQPLSVGRSLRSFASSPALAKFKKNDPNAYACYVVSDDKYVFNSGSQNNEFEDKCVEACKGGATIVQLRLKNVNTRTYCDTFRSLRAKLTKSGFEHIPVVIDDRIDVALACNADGAHVGDGDMDPAVARKLLGPDKILGVSTYGSKEIAQSVLGGGTNKDQKNIADYVAGGGVFSSTTKKYVTKGVAHLHEFKQSVGAHVPVVAIGGLSAETAEEVAFVGADGVACVSAIFENDVNHVKKSTETIKKNVERGVKMRELYGKTFLKSTLSKLILENEFANINQSTGRFKMATGETLANAVADVRRAKPLVQCMTNFVSMDIMANVLIAASCSPAMVHTIEEAREFSNIASAVSINPGTLDKFWVESFIDVAEHCSSTEKVWVLDPVGNGATAYRSGVFTELLKKKPTVIRGNPGEIAVCAKQMGVEIVSGKGMTGGSKGVDSLLDSSDIDPALPDGLAAKLDSIVVMTGSSDYITDGKSHKYLACHAAPALQNITAAGCSLSSLVGAFVAVDRSKGEAANPARAAAHACAYYTLATQLALRELGKGGFVGPGSVRVGLLDWLQRINEDELRAFGKIQTLS